MGKAEKLYKWKDLTEDKQRRGNSEQGLHGTTPEHPTKKVEGWRSVVQTKLTSAKKGGGYQMQKSGMLAVKTGTRPKSTAVLHTSEAQPKKGRVSMCWVGSWRVKEEKGLEQISSYL